MNQLIREELLSFIAEQTPLFTEQLNQQGLYDSAYWKALEPHGRLTPEANAKGGDFRKALEALLMEGAGYESRPDFYEAKRDATYLADAKAAGLLPLLPTRDLLNTYSGLQQYRLSYFLNHEGAICPIPLDDGDDDFSMLDRGNLGHISDQLWNPAYWTAPLLPLGAAYFLSYQGGWDEGRSFTNWEKQYENCRKELHSYIDELAQYEGDEEAFCEDYSQELLDAIRFYQEHFPEGTSGLGLFWDYSTEGDELLIRLYLGDGSYEGLDTRDTQPEKAAFTKEEVGAISGYHGYTFANAELLDCGQAPDDCLASELPPAIFAYSFALFLYQQLREKAWELFPKSHSSNDTHELLSLLELHPEAYDTEDFYWGGEEGEENLNRWRKLARELCF